MKPSTFGIAVAALLHVGCERPAEVVSVPPRSEVSTMSKPTGTYESPGSVVRAEWSWVATSNASARIHLFVKPSVSAQSVEVAVRLPHTVAIAGGDARKSFQSTRENTRLPIAFDVGYPVDSRPVIPVSVAIIREGQQRLDVVIPVHDPSRGAPFQPEDVVAPRDIGGLPARVSGELEPSKK